MELGLARRKQRSGGIPLREDLAGEQRVLAEGWDALLSSRGNGSLWSSSCRLGSLTGRRL